MSYITMARNLIMWTTSLFPELHYHSLSWFCFSFPHTRWGEGKQQSVQASLHASHSSVVSGHLTFTTSVVLPHANVLPVCSYQWHWEEENKNRKGNKVKLDTLMTVNKVFSSGVRRRSFFGDLISYLGSCGCFVHCGLVCIHFLVTDSQWSSHFGLCSRKPPFLANCQACICSEQISRVGFVLSVERRLCEKHRRARWRHKTWNVLWEPITIHKTVLYTQEEI